MFGLRNRQQKNDPEDDGRTIADMNVDGMPWYVRGDRERADSQSGTEKEPLNEEQIRMYRRAAIKAALLIVLVFGTVFFLFIAFCDFIWFR